MDRRQLSIGDEVWIATALLHRERPDQADFTPREIAERVRREKVVGQFRQGVRPHIYLHAVANRPPNQARLRLLYATSDDRRRLFRAGDTYHPDREGPTQGTGTRTVPDRSALPEEYRDLVDWYRAEYSTVDEQCEPILALRGLGKAIWDEPADAYVARLRSNWA